MKKYKTRADVPQKYKWDLTEYFKDEDDFKNHFQKAEKLIIELTDYKGCTKDARQLYKYLQKELMTNALVLDLYIYAIVIYDQEIGIASSIERKNKATALYSDFSKSTSFFAPELLKLSNKEYKNLFKDEEGLLEFKASLDCIYREKKHILSEKDENLITELIDSMNYFSNMSATMLHSEHNYGTVIVNGKKEKIATNNYRIFLKNKDQNIRKKVYQQFNQKLDEYGNSCASYLNGYVHMQQTYSKLHHYKNAWDKKIFDLNLSDKVFRSLVDVVENHLGIFQKYFYLRKKVLGFSLHPYDLNLSLGEISSQYTIEEAQRLVQEALRPLGKEYLDKYKKIIDNHYIDYCQYHGKRDGGYNISGFDKNSLILMSFNGDLTSVSTIAHECGHHIHKQFLQEYNKMQYSMMYIIVSEVASLTNECLLSNYISKNAKTKEEKLAGLENMISTIVSNLFLAVREGKMEEDMYQEVEKKNTLTQEYLDNLNFMSLKKYYGDSIEMDASFKNSWITRGHYYMNFYLYSYAICISVASSVASQILSGNKEMLNKYIEFLKVGKDKWPIDAFKVLGIDLEDKKVYEEAIYYFNSLLDDYEKIYDKEVYYGK